MPIPGSYPKSFRSLQWGGVAAAAAAAAVVGTGAACADTPDDVIGQAIGDLNQGVVVLDAAPAADLSAHQADSLASTVTFSTEISSPLQQIASIQDGLSASDQSFLAGADEQFVLAAQNLLVADHVFVAADQAGELSGNGLTAADLGLVQAELGFVPALFDAGGATLLADFDPSIGALGAASAASELSTNAVQPIVTSYPFELLNDAASNLADADQVLTSVPAGDVTDLLAPQLNFQSDALQAVGDLANAQTAIEAYDNGVLADLATPFFNGLDQGFASTTESLLNADQALDVALVGGTGVEAAELTVIAADFGVAGDAFSAFATDLASMLF
jgi:hypothetical protein